MLLNFRASVDGKDWLNFDLGSRAYDFNNYAESNGAVKHAVIIQQNCGFAVKPSAALFDIVSLFCDNQSIHDQSVYEFFYFHYEFILNGQHITVKYSRNEQGECISEFLEIDGVDVVGFELSSLAAENNGTGGFNPDFGYYAINPNLLERSLSMGLQQLVAYIKGMRYISLDLGSEDALVSTFNYIASNGLVDRLNKFMNEVGYMCRLAVSKQGNLVLEDNNNQLPLIGILSSGASMLIALFAELCKCGAYNGQGSIIYFNDLPLLLNHECFKNLYKYIFNLSIQSITSTNHTLIVSNSLLRPDCYFIENSNNYTIQCIVDTTDKELRKPHNLEKMLRAGCFYDNSLLPRKSLLSLKDMIENTDFGLLKDDPELADWINMKPVGREII